MRVAGVMELSEMLSTAEKLSNLVVTDPESIGENNLIERMFYMDCDPQQALDRTVRAGEVAGIINTSNAFGSLRSQDSIREAFQAEVEVSRSPAEALSRMVKFLSLINLKLDPNLKLGPMKLGVYERIYLSNSDAPTQSLDLNLRLSEYGKKSNRQSKCFTSVA